MVKRIFTIMIIIVTIAGCVFYYLYAYIDRIGTLSLLMALGGFGALVTIHGAKIGLKPVSYDKDKHPLRPEVLRHMGACTLVAFAGGISLYYLVKLTDKRTERIMKGPTAIATAIVVDVDSTSSIRNGKKYIYIIEYPTIKGIIQQDITSKVLCYHLHDSIDVKYSLEYPEMFYYDEYK